MKTALVIMAAGIGSRFGGGIKQLEPVGLHNEIIMDYSIHDAIEAGFNRVVFVIRHDIEEAFRKAIGVRIEGICASLGVEVAYAYQELKNLPEGVSLPEGRTKPWGTGQAVLACRGLVDCPFVVINADDYYGKEAFCRIHDFLVSGVTGSQLCMAGFVLKNTLSEHGGVTRGICEMNEQGCLTGVVETKNIVKTTEGAEVDGRSVDGDSLVSMNMWGLSPEFLDLLEEGFERFFQTAGPQDLIRGEYLLPIYIDQLIQEGRISVQVLKTSDKWFGVTYKEDKPKVVQSFLALIRAGVYQEELFSDLVGE